MQIKQHYSYNKNKREYVVCLVVSGIEGNPMSFGFVEGRGVGGEEGLEDFTFRLVLLETHSLAFA